MTDPRVVNLDDFDAVAESAAGTEFELKGTDGITGTGVHMKIIGKHSDVVQNWTNRLVNKIFRDTEYAKRRGKQVEPQSIEEIRENNIQGAIIRCVGWRGPSQPFDLAVLDRALRRNPHWIDQIIDASDDLGNFTKAPSKN